MGRRQFVLTEMFDGISRSESTLDRKGRVWVVAGGLVLIAVIMLVQRLAIPSTVPWSVAGGKLQIHTKVWSDDFPLGDLELDRARVVDLNREPGWRPDKKSWGFDGAGYSAGRFKLRNGGSADLYLTHETMAVVIPRSRDVPVLVGVSDSKALLAALHRAGQ